MGGLLLVLALFLNPIVLHPRFWNATVVAREVAMDATIIVIGLGLVVSRKWAAVFLSLVSAFLIAEGGGVFAICVFLTSLILDAMFWSALIDGKRRDLLYFFTAVLISLLMESLAFVLRRT
jgi:hypothetical protein